MFGLCQNEEQGVLASLFGSLVVDSGNGTKTNPCANRHCALQILCAVGLGEQFANGGGSGRLHVAVRVNKAGGSARGERGKRLALIATVIGEGEFSGDVSHCANRLRKPIWKYKEKNRYVTFFFRQQI